LDHQPPFRHHCGFVLEVPVDCYLDDTFGQTCYPPKYTLGHDMNYSNPNVFSFLDCLSSVFDLAGTVNMTPRSKGIDHDIDQLCADQNKLKEDYKKACDRLFQTFL
jgi:hypothetical protein